MKCWSIPVGYLGTNCYIITEDQVHCVLIDPGDDSGEILSFLQEHNLLCSGILLTHGHDDHTGALEDIIRETDAQVWIGEDDAYRLISAPYNTVKDNDKITLADLEFTVVSVPGHTEGSVLYLCDHLMFSGDTLFCRSIGRTDLPGGDWDKMQVSLKKILAMNEDYHVLPGHGPSTTLSSEKEKNSFLHEIVSEQQ